MFGARSVLRQGLQAKNAPLMQSLQPCREMATLKDISLRLKSVKNILKITSSMKMIAAARYVLYALSALVGLTSFTDTKTGFAIFGNPCWFD